MNARLLRTRLCASAGRPRIKAHHPTRANSPIAPPLNGATAFQHFPYSYSSSTPPTPSPSPSSSSPSTPPAFSTAIFSPSQPPSLPHRLSHLSHWTLTPSKKGITRTYTFASFASAWRFMSRVADECKAKRHHPSWHNLYNEVTVEWTTHEPEGLSVKDVEMAEFCDRVAGEIGVKGKGKGGGK